jgi:hypothetical protein
MNCAGRSAAAELSTAWRDMRITTDCSLGGERRLDETPNSCGFPVSRKTAHKRRLGSAKAGSRRNLFQMSSKPQKFTKRDVMKAVAGVVAAGLPVARVEVSINGEVVDIAVIAGEPTTIANPSENPWLAEIGGGS